MLNRLLENKAAMGAICTSLLLSSGVLYHSPVHAQETSREDGTELEVNSNAAELEEMNTETEIISEPEAQTVGEPEAAIDSNDLTEEDTGLDADPIEIIEAGDSLVEPNAEEPNAEHQQAEEPAERDNVALFQNLKRYLDSGELEKADKETFRLLRVLVGEQSERQGYFSLSEWNQFVADESNCPNVQRIDQLWREASNGTLGFGEQKRLFEATAGNALNFYRAIGWVEPDGLNTAVEWMRIRVATSAEQAIAYVSDKEPNFQNPVSGHLPAAMYWEENENGSHTDRRLALFAKCDL